MLANVHSGLALPSDLVDFATVVGKYDFYHYMVDGVDDRGWGCGYRTLQTICSWVHSVLKRNNPLPVPSLLEIQETLVNIGDKPRPFLGSKDWIGSFEACLCMDQIYGVSSKIVHVGAGGCVERDAVSVLFDHFRRFGAPVMIGGDVDASSKTLLGVCKTSDRGCFFLIANPHFYGKADKSSLQSEGWVQWKHSTDVFKSESFYNFCLPQLKPEINNEKH